MKKMIQAALLASTFALLAACGGPTLDGKNQITLEQSFKEMVADMSQDEAAQLASDMATISTNIMTEMGGISLESMSKMGDLMLEKLDGKTATDIHDMAEDIREG